MSQKKKTKKEIVDFVKSRLNWHECESCGQRKEDVSFGEDPYQSEINDNHTEVWMCADCRYESSMGI